MDLMQSLMAAKLVNNEGGGGTGDVVDVKVNGVSVLDDNKIAQITSYKEITQEQYDALPSSKLTDNILYAITDSAAGMKIIEISQSDYDELPSSQKQDVNTLYFITEDEE